MIRYVSRKSLSSDKKALIIKEMERYLELGIKVNFEHVDQLKRTKAGKLKQFVSNLKT